MIESLVLFVVYALVIGLILGLLLWVVDQLPWLPPPFRQVARVVITVVGCLILIYMLLSLIGAAPPLRRIA